MSVLLSYKKKKFKKKKLSASNAVRGEGGEKTTSN